MSKKRKENKKKNRNHGKEICVFSMSLENTVSHTFIYFIFSKIYRE